MIVVLDSGVWISRLHFAGAPQAALDIAFIFDQIAICDDIVREISTALLAKFGWTLKDVRAILRGYLAVAK